MIFTPETNICGVYTITNKINGKVYVGSSSCIGKRFWEHMSALKNDKHHSRYLQRAFNKYGIENFSFEVLIECLPEHLLGEEQYWINELWAYNHIHGYNSVPVAGSTRGMVFTKEHRDKLSKAKLGKPRPDNILKNNLEYREKFCSMTKKSVEMIDMKTANVIMEFKSITDAAKHVNGSVSAISLVCSGSGRIYKHKGYYWRYSNKCN